MKAPDEEINKPGDYNIGYTIVTRKLGSFASEGPQDVERMQNTEGVVFSTHSVRKTESGMIDPEEIPIFSEDELILAVHSIQTIKIGDLPDRQYGLRKGRSTVDAINIVVEVARITEQGNDFSRPICLLVTLDVKNALNSAKWSEMLEALEHTFRIPKYLL